MTARRLPCCVPGCGRSTLARGFNEWICAGHWSLLPKETRRVYSRAKGRTNREWRKFDPGTAWPKEAAKHRLWNWLKRTAIERAVGLS